MTVVYIYNSRPSLVSLAPRMVDGKAVPGAKLIPGVNEVPRETYEAHVGVAPVSTWFGPGGFLRLVDPPDASATPAAAAPEPAPAPKPIPGVTLGEGFEDGDGSEEPAIPIYTTKARGTFVPPDAPHDPEEVTAPAEPAPESGVESLTLMEAKALISEETDADVLHEWRGKETRKRVLLALDARLRELEG